MSTLSLRFFDPSYPIPPSSIGSRWNWHKSQLITFPNGSTEMAHRHPNGGGWVSDTAYVSLSVYVAPYGSVYNRARVFGDVMVGDYAQIYEDAVVFGKVKLDAGQSIARGNSRIFGKVYFVPGRGESYPSNAVPVFGEIQIKDGAGIIDDDLAVYGNYKASPGQILSDTPPLCHSKYDPITKTKDLNLVTGEYVTSESDYSGLEGTQEAEPVTLPQRNDERITIVLDDDIFEGYYAEGGGAPPPELTEPPSEPDATPPCSPGATPPVGLPSNDGIDKVATAAYNAGFRGEDLVTAVAIAGAESAFKANAVGDQHLANSKWGNSYGYFQVRSLRNPSQYSGSDAMRDASTLSDPQNNANAAFAIAQESQNRGRSSFAPWSTYTSGAYRKFLADARAAVGRLCT